MHDLINRSCFNPGGSGGVAVPYVPIAGGTMTGPLILSADATAPKQAVAFDQLPTGGPFLPTAGGILVGAAAQIVQPNAPSAGNDLVNKIYVDTEVATAPAGPYAFVGGLTVNNGYVTLSIPGLGIIKFMTTA